MAAHGSYFPLHDFGFDTSGKPSNLAVATDREQFRKMVSNPGPLRIVLSDDYMDWYYSAYTERVRHQRHHHVVQTRFQYTTSHGSDGGVSSALKPSFSMTRQRGNDRQAAGLRSVDDATKSLGWIDLFERRAQFPQIHIDRCSSTHVKELLANHVVVHEINADDVWARALMYREMLRQRRASYPRSFDYVFSHVDNCTFAKAGEPPEDAPTKEVYGETAHHRFATEASQEYYGTLVRKYHIDNAVDAYIVLKCHRRDDAERVLFSNPPPLEDATVAATPPAMPSLDAFLNDEANDALRRVLLFAEFNCQTTTTPFNKYPRAAAIITRPSPQEHREQEAQQSATELLASQRSGLLSSLTFTQQKQIGARSRDVVRLQQGHSGSDSAWFDQQVRADGFNPRAVRAETRDRLTRKLVAGLREYRAGRSNSSRPNVTATEESWRSRHGSSHNAHSTTPLHRPTPQHFLQLILEDPGVRACRNRSGVDAVDPLCRAYAVQLFTLAMEFHVPERRKVLHQSALCSAARLDEVVSSGCDRQFPPFASRQLSQYGFPSESRYEDYSRWMAAPAQ